MNTNNHSFHSTNIFQDRPLNSGDRLSVTLRVIPEARGETMEVVVRLLLVVSLLSSMALCGYSVTSASQPAADARTMAAKAAPAARVTPVSYPVLAAVHAAAPANIKPATL